MSSKVGSTYPRGPAGSRCTIAWLVERPGDLDVAEQERALLSLPLSGRVVCSPLAELRVEVADGAPALRALADRLLTMLTRRAPRRAARRVGAVSGG